MPVYDLLIDDSSPVIRFGNAWNEPRSDPGVVNYYNQTFHGTQSPNAKAQFSFYGTSVTLYGSNFYNHGPYQVAVDGTVKTTEDGYSADRKYRVELASYTLSQGNHDVELINAWTDASKNWLDLDYLTITTGDGNNKTSSQDYILDDTAANFTYDVAGKWMDTPNSLSPTYYQQTFHSTNTLNAKLLIVFDGNAVGLYGATSGNHDAYSVALDGGSSVVYNGSAKAFRPGTLLYYASGLPSGSHTLTVTNLGSGTNGYLDIDRLVVSRWESSQTGEPQPSDTATPSTHHKVNVGAIAGGVVGGIAALLLFGLFALFLLRRQRRRRTGSVLEEHKPDLGAIHPGAMVQTLPVVTNVTGPPLPLQSPTPQPIFDAPPPAYEEGMGGPRHTYGTASGRPDEMGSSTVAMPSTRRLLPSPPAPESPGPQSRKGMLR